MFRVQKQEFKLEGIPVRSIKKLNLLYLFVSTMITFVKLKIEKKNSFFMSLLNKRGIKDKNQIKMFLYRFLAGMKAILEKILAEYSILNT